MTAPAEPAGSQQPAMRRRQVVLNSRRVHLAPRPVDQRLVTEVRLKVDVVRVQQPRPADLSGGDDVRIVRTAGVPLLQHPSSAVHRLVVQELDAPGQFRLTTPLPEGLAAIELAPQPTAGHETDPARVDPVEEGPPGRGALRAEHLPSHVGVENGAHAITSVSVAFLP